MKNHEFDGFTVNLFLDEDGDYLAHFVEMPNVSAFSDTPEGALRELAVAWQGVKESYRKHNEPIPQASSREEVVGWALPTINAVTLRAGGANRQSQTNRNGGHCPPYNRWG